MWLSGLFGYAYHHVPIASFGILGTPRVINIPQCCASTVGGTHHSTIRIQPLAGAEDGKGGILFAVPSQFAATIGAGVGTEVGKTAVVAVGGIRGEGITVKVE